MFCMYPPCPPASFLPLQRPVPLWGAPSVVPPSPGASEIRGVAQDSPDTKHTDLTSASGALARIKEEDLVRGQRLGLLPSRNPELVPISGKRRRPGSAGPKLYNPSTGSIPSRTNSSGDDDPRLGRTWDSNSSPEIESGIRISDEQTKTSGELGCGGREGLGLTLPVVYRDGSSGSSKESPQDSQTETGGKPHRWPMTPPSEDSHHKPRSNTGVVQWNALGSPIRGSLTPPCTKKGTLKFGIDSILNNKDGNTNDASPDHPGTRFLTQTTTHLHPHHHQHPQHQTLLSQRTLPPLLRIRPSKTAVNVGLNFVYPAPGVYPPHLFNLPQSPLHFHLPSSSSSTSSLSPSSSSSPSSSAIAGHLRGHVLTHPPPLHYSIHHPSFSNPSHRHPDFSAGNAYALLGSNSDLHSPHLHPHSKKKRSWSRAVFSNLQRKGLEKRFEVQKYVTKPDRRQLAAMLGLTDAQVKVWFQNRRMKWRHQEETMKKKDPEPPRKPTQRRPSPPSHGDPTPNDQTSGFEPDCNSRSVERSNQSEDSDDDGAGLLSGGRIHGPRSSGDAVVGSASLNVTFRPTGIMSVADILDLKKDRSSSLDETGSDAVDGGNDGDDDDDDNDDDDDDGGEDDVMSVISSGV